MSFLQRLAQLRLFAREINDQIEHSMPEAILEALSVFEHRQNAKNQIVYEDKMAKIVLSFRKCFCTDEENPALSRLDADIKAATSQLARKHAIELEQIDVQIKQLQEVIAQLEATREKLLCDRQVSQLKKRYDKAFKESASLIPKLSVFIK